jgi:hypothetical protein
MAWLTAVSSRCASASFIGVAVAMLELGGVVGEGC